MRGGLKVAAALVAYSILFGAALAAPKSIEVILPVGSKVLEIKDIGDLAGKPRLLVLWMSAPAEKHVAEPDAYWSCPQSVYGDYWLGAAKLSVINPVTGTVISTINIVGSAAGQLVDTKGGKLTVIPFQYHSPGGGKPEKASILNLKDFTGQGRAAQFPLRGYFACGQDDTSLLGYDVEGDQAVQYPVIGNGGESNLWVPHVFSTAPLKPGSWDFTWSFAHGSHATYHEVVNFDPKRGAFIQETAASCDSSDSKSRCR